MPSSVEGFVCLWSTSRDGFVNLFQTRLEAFPPDEVVTTVITMEEQRRGWLALMHRVTDAQRQVAYYKRLLGLVAFFAEWEVLPFDQHAAVTFERLRQQRVRIGTMDLHDRIGGEYEVCGRERMAEGGGAERSASGGLSRARGGNMLR